LGLRVKDEGLRVKGEGLGFTTTKGGRGGEKTKALGWMGLLQDKKGMV
jgi:hypothetical protein